MQQSEFRRMQPAQERDLGFGQRDVAANRLKLAVSTPGGVLPAVFLCPFLFVAACKFLPPSFGPAHLLTVPSASSASSSSRCTEDALAGLLRRRRRHCHLKFNDAGRRSFFLCRSVVRQVPLPKLSRVLARCTCLPVGFRETAVTRLRMLPVSRFAHESVPEAIKL
jgi:hypothetical protein